MKNVFEIEIKGEKKQFSLGRETWEKFFERSGVIQPLLKNELKENCLEVLVDILQIGNEIVTGNPCDKDELAHWLAKDPLNGIDAVMAACDEMQTLLNISDN